MWQCNSYRQNDIVAWIIIIYETKSNKNIINTHCVLRDLNILCVCMWNMERKIELNQCINNDDDDDGDIEKKS